MTGGQIFALSTPLLAAGFAWGAALVMNRHWAKAKAVELAAESNKAVQQNLAHTEREKRAEA